VTGSPTLRDLSDRGVVELVYEYGPLWTVKIMFLSRYELGGAPAAARGARCVTGAGAAPPEAVPGPVRFRRLLAALTSGRFSDRREAERELGAGFRPDYFDVNACSHALAGL